MPLVSALPTLRGREKLRRKKPCSVSTASLLLERGTRTESVSWPESRSRLIMAPTALPNGEATTAERTLRSESPMARAEMHASEKSIPRSIAARRGGDFCRRSTSCCGPGEKARSASLPLADVV